MCKLLVLKSIRLLIYSAIVTPYLISFPDQDPPWSDIFDYVLYISFFLDMILAFFTGIVDGEENIIYNKKVYIFFKFCLENHIWLSERVVFD
jgi:hypothetical protein